MCFINAIFIITVNRSSTRVGSVVISNGAYLIVVAIAVLIETIGTVMINSGINLNQVLLQVHWKHCWHGISNQRNGHSSRCCCCCTNRNNRNNTNPEAAG